MAVVALLFTGTGCREEEGIRITGLDLRGVEQVNEGELRNALETRRGTWIPWGRQRYFDRRAFEADLKRIEAFYRDRGFPDARVISFDLELSDAQDEIAVTINVVEGEPIVVSEVALHGFDVLPERQQRELRATLPLKEGFPLDRQLAIASRERAMNLLRDQGYPYAQVMLTDEEIAPRQRRVSVTATPGLQAAFGPIEIAGAQSVDREVLRRQLTFEPGDRFMRQRMRESQRKLYRLELFQFVNIESLENPEQPTVEVPVRVTVAEGPHQRVTFGLGYGTEEQARARIRWDHANFLGDARHLGFEGKWSSLDRGVRLDFREPYFFHPNVSLNFEGQAWQAAEPFYSANSVGGRLIFQHEPNPRTRWALSLINEYQRSVISPEALLDEDGQPRFDIRDDLIALGLDPTDGVQEGTVAAVAVEATRSTVDAPLDARRGYSLTGRVEQANARLWGTFNYMLFTAEGRYFLPVRRNVILANRLRVGSIEPFGDIDENVPFHKRFFLGGASSIRGWGRFEVSPLSGFGLPIGGHSMLEGSAELRFPVRGSFGAVAFLDYGNVWLDAWDFNLGELRYTAGPGLRYLTPIGPARLDLGYQLNPVEELLINGEPQRRRWRVHFSIGQAF